MPVPLRPKSFNEPGCPGTSAWGITRRFHRLSPGKGLVAYALRTRAPLSESRRTLPVRLACIRPAASVHPEPGSNSSLYYCCTFLFSCLGFRCCFQVYLACFLCWLQTFKEPSPSTPLPSLRAKTAAKLPLFLIQTTKIEYFFQKNLESHASGSPTVL